jgi:hypothetical protein
MGLIFNKKLPTGGTVFKKRVSDKDISKKDIRKISEEMGFTRTGAEHHFKKFLMRAQEGGLDRKEFHKGMENMIREGYATKKQAMRMTREAGIERKDLRYYKSMSEYRAMERKENASENKKEIPREKSVVRPKDNSPAKNETRTAPPTSNVPEKITSLKTLPSNISSNSSSLNSEDAKSSGHKSIYSLLNK